MFKEAHRPAWVEIDLNALAYNVSRIRERAGSDRKLIGVIKADAYGHGAVRIAQALKKNGITTFAIATLSEAIALRTAGIEDEIMILDLTPDMYVDDLIENDIIPVTCSYSNAKAISDAALAAGKTVSGLIVLDTGMGRIGYLPDDPDAVGEIKKISELPGFRIRGLFSHFATADEADKTYAREQEAKFVAFSEKLAAAGVEIPLRMLANSAATMEIDSAHFDAVRPGIILYGYYPSDEVDRSLLDLKPVMSVKAAVLQLKTIPAGATVSYGRRFRAERPTKIATLGLGYADGFPRAYSPKGKVIINGRFAPIAGTICMDQFMVDVTDVPGVKEGDEAIVMGTDGNLAITAEDIAAATGTISYEILCDFGSRMPKIYLE